MGEINYTIRNRICRARIQASEEPVEVVKAKGGMLVTGGRDNLIKIWDIHSLELKRTLRGHSNWIRDVVISKKFIISASKDRTVRIWDKNSGKCLRVFNGHSGDILNLDIQGNMLASASSDATIKLWDLETGQEIRTFKGHARIVSQVKIVKNRIISASWDHVVKIWDLNTGECLESYEIHYDAINALACLGKKLIATGDQSKIIRIWDRENHTVVKSLAGIHKRMIMQIEIKQNKLISCSQDGTCAIWDLNSGKCVKKLEGHRDAVLCLSIDKNLIITGAADGQVLIWDDFSTNSKDILEIHEDMVIIIASDGKKAISVGKENVIFVWDVASGECVKKINAEVSGWIWGAEMTSDGRVIISSDEGFYKVFEMDTGRLLQTLKGHDGTVYRVNVRKNLAATTSFDNTVRVWNIDTGECIQVLEGHVFPTYSAVIIDDTRVVSAGSGGNVFVWDYRTGKCLKKFKEHTDEIFHLAAEGNIVVTACADNTIRAYDIDKNECVALLEGHSDQVWTVQIKNGIIFSGSLDSTIKIWSLENGNCLETFYEHQGAVKDLCIHGDVLLSGSGDTTIRVWDISRWLNKDKNDDQNKISEENVTLISLIQVGRTYDLLPKPLSDPNIPRIIHGLVPLESNTRASYDTSNLLKLVLDKVKTWRKLGHLGYGIWINDLISYYNENQEYFSEAESLEIILHEFLLGLRESPEMFWFGLLRSLHPFPERKIADSWSFDLYFSGQGPAPVEGFKWKKLGPQFNKVKLGDREETALVFKLTLKDVPEWFIPIIKSINIQIKDDRGDIDYMEFNDFLTDDNGNWSTLAMFKVDDGYKNEPSILLDITDIMVVYDESLSPNFGDVEIIDAIASVSKKQSLLSNRLDEIDNRLENMLEREKVDACVATSPIDPSKIPINTDISIIDGLNSSSEAIKLFKTFSSRFKTPPFGTIRVRIGEKFNKFIEHLEPKLIFFSSATAITSALLTLALYFMVFNPDLNLLGPPIYLAIFDVYVSVVEIIVYFGIYGALIVFLLYSIWSWVKYQRAKREFKENRLL